MAEVGRSPGPEKGHDAGAPGCWALDPAVIYLNHGSFGACPVAVLEAQAELRARMERHPGRFLVQELPGLLEEARAELGAFVGADPDDLGFVPNATSGVNTVLRSLSFSPGDELLTTDHEYNACRNALDFTAARTGAEVVVATVPFPLRSPDDVVSAVLERVTPRTRFVLLDHVTSPTGLVQPVERVGAALAGTRAELMIDGAHAPGMIPLDIPRLGAAYYTGNAHKWLCTPKGSAFLWVRRDRQNDIQPLTISHGYNARRTDRSRFRLLFDWTGTVDPTPHLCIPTALRWLGGRLPGGWPELMARNRRLALEARDLLCATLDIAPPAPDEMIATLVALPIPDGDDPDADPANPDDPLARTLFDRHGIDVVIFFWPAAPRRLLRVSAQLYNRREHYERLADVLRRELGPPGGEGEHR